VPSGLRLAISLLTVVPVRRRDDGPEPLSAARRSMLWAPLVGLLVGAIAAGVMALGTFAGQGSFLAAALGVATSAALTRGLHLDGLADTADGLGTRLPPEEALAVMGRGDTGPFGVVSVVLILLVQVSAAAQAGPIALMFAATLARVAMTWSCRRGVPAARPDGLGALVAGTVSPALAAMLALVTLLAAVSMGPTGALGVLAGLAAGEILLRRCVRRLGGVTGDVLGAVGEVAASVALVIFAAG
jgi:adenosylcobinamide-GDP ribazoletransferase